jgi:5-formyltetrahydrofolate cyclo-ligase
MPDRQALRKRLLRQRSQLDRIQQISASVRITQQLSQHSLFLTRHAIATYIPIHREIDPSALIKQAWQDHKRCYLPILQGQQLIFGAYQADMRFKKNRFNIPEPIDSTCALIEPEALDLVLVPLVGFTLQGQRLGMGAGFYDRSFAFLLKQARPTRPFLLGLAYEWQKLASFSEESWDVPLNAVLTEEKFYFCR